MLDRSEANNLDFLGEESAMNTDKAVYDVEAKKLRDATVYLFLQMERAITEENGLARFRIRGPEFTGDDYLLVAGSLSEDCTPVVAFHKATTLPGVIIGFANRLRNGSLKWHVDKFAKGKD